METAVYNAQKADSKRLMWNSPLTIRPGSFSQCSKADDIRMITDFEDGIPISEFNYARPIWIYDISRADIGYNRKKAEQLRRQYE